jgi:hypothetical protein
MLESVQASACRPIRLEIVLQAVNANRDAAFEQEVLRTYREGRSKLTMEGKLVKNCPKLPAQELTRLISRVLRLFCGSRSCQRKMMLGAGADSMQSLPPSILK